MATAYDHYVVSMVVSPLRREAGRVILLDPQDQVLLLQGCDVTLDPRPTWWFTPGGGCDPGEDHAAAARREVREELGLEVGPLSRPVHERQTDFTFEGQPIRQHELYFAVRVMAPFEVDRAGWSDVEQRSILGHRWWGLRELRASRETFYPEELVEVLERVLPSV